ncbi:MAG: HAMP domain-containing histidine kinase [Clostridia bacterium]|nr:HAMP domain-containing histidine kinase [Clostridia bacterium]
MKKQILAAAERRKKKKIKFSLFSFHWIAALFIMSGVSILYTLTVYRRLADYLETTDSESLEFWLGLGTFLFLSLLFTLIGAVSRKITVKDPIMKILQATERIGAGDFSVRLPVKMRFRNEYDVIGENINTLAQELSGIETLRQDFVANVSHEFKAPLALIQSSSELLARNDLTEEDRRKYAKNVTDASKRLSAMVTNILTLNKIENRKIFTKSNKVLLGEQLREEVLLFEPEWTAKSITVDIDADDSVFVYGDKELLALMWSNLLSNAFKFTPEGGTVTAEVKEADGKILVSVADTGPGIPPEQRERIFEKFYQGDVSHVTRGNGLGLALVKSVADLCGYTVAVESEQGAGSCFTVTLNKTLS